MQSLIIVKSAVRRWPELKVKVQKIKLVSNWHWLPGTFTECELKFLFIVLSLCYNQLRGLEKAQKGCTAHGRLRIFWQGCRGLRPLFADLQEHISQLVQLRQPCKLSQYSAFKPIDTSGHGRKDGYRAAEQRRLERCSYQFAVLAWNAGACIGGLGNVLYCAVVRMCHKSTPL